MSWIFLINYLIVSIKLWVKKSLYICLKTDVWTWYSSHPTISIKKQLCCPDYIGHVSSIPVTKAPGWGLLLLGLLYVHEMSHLLWKPPYFAEHAHNCSLSEVTDHHVQLSDYGAREAYPAKSWLCEPGKVTSHFLGLVSLARKGLFSEWHKFMLKNFPIQYSIQ